MEDEQNQTFDPSYFYDVDYENSTVKVTKLGRYYVTNTYKVLPQGAVEYTELNTEQTDSQINFDLKLKNTLKQMKIEIHVQVIDLTSHKEEQVQK